GRGWPGDLSARRPPSLLSRASQGARPVARMARADVVALAVRSGRARRTGGIVMTLDFSLDRTVEIRARPATVFRFFTDPARWARWWGEGSTIDPIVGGAVRIVYPGGERVSGVVRELVPEQR